MGIFYLHPLAQRGKSYLYILWLESGNILPVSRIVDVVSRRKTQPSSYPLGPRIRPLTKIKQLQ
jgi:hypothetical protein